MNTTSPPFEVLIHNTGRDKSSTHARTCADSAGRRVSAWPTANVREAPQPKQSPEIDKKIGRRRLRLLSREPQLSSAYGLCGQPAWQVILLDERGAGLCYRFIYSNLGKPN